METSHQKSPPPKKNVLLWMTVCILGMIAIKAALSTSGINQESRIAGFESGDIAVDRNILSPEVDGWKCTAFHSPQADPDNPGDTFWWSHRWTFQKTGLDSLVSFDQAGWKSWHELTECYQNTGWTLTGRKDIDSTDSQQRPWHYVMATFTQPNRHGILLFSEFYEDGTPVKPRRLTLKEAIDWARRNEQTEQTNDLTDRLGFVPENGKKTPADHDRVLQCQVFLVSNSMNPNRNQIDLETLHRHTREQIRKEWLHQSGSSQPKSSLSFHEGGRP